MTLRNAPDKSRFIMESFGQNLVIEADACMMTPLGVSKQSLVINQPQVPIPHTDKAGVRITFNVNIVLFLHVMILCNL